MNSTHSTIGPLTKVGLELIFTPESSPKATPPHKMKYAFIYGLGVDGITPFEKALYGKSPQVSMDFHMGAHEPFSFFGHLSCDLLQGIPVSAPFNLNVSVVSVEAADEREVVRAMAAASVCGGDCDCGCGC